MDHYETLGVTRDASDVEIKRAWARMVRQHPPDQDPEGNRRLNEAKAVLLDPQARADYDARSQYGDFIEALFTSATAAMEIQDWETSIRSFKEILALVPTNRDARNQLGLALAYAEDWEAAVRQFDRLVAEAPDTALYAANLGHVYRSWGGKDASVLPKAEKWFKRAIALEPYNAEHHLDLARLYVRLELFLAAEAAVEAAISADGKVDVDDIDALMELAFVYLFSKQKGKIRDVADRVRAILPDEPEARAYAAFRFVSTAADLSSDYLAFQDADLFVQAARRIKPDLGELAEGAASIERCARIDREADAMREERTIQPQVVPAFLAAIAHRRLGFEIPDDYVDGLAMDVKGWSPKDVKRAAELCRRKYPFACASVEDLMQMILGSEPSLKPEVHVSGNLVAGIALLIVGGLMLLGGVKIGMLVLIFGGFRLLRHWGEE